MAIQVSTEQYQQTYRKAPRGSGAWAFEVEAVDRMGNVNTAEIFVPWMPTYSAAVKEAKRIVRERYSVTEAVISVCP